MRNILIIAGMALYMLAACKDEDYPVYNTAQKDGVFMEYDVNTDSIFYNFGFDSKTSYIHEIKVKLLGMPKDIDRKVCIKVNPEKYADEEFVAARSSYYNIPSEIILPADSIEARIPVELIRDPELEDIRSILTVELEESEDLMVRGHSEFTITFDDKIPSVPEWWLSYKWGPFDKFKGQLFFKYFWEMEEENKYLYDKIVGRWGKNLDIPPLKYANSPIVKYPYAFAMYVEMKMWEYSEAHPELDLKIMKPVIY